MLDNGTNSVTDMPDSNTSRSLSPQIEQQDSPAASESSTHSRQTPKYSAEELGAMFLDFYKFMATLHFDIKDLHIPPPGGWPTLIPPIYNTLKSPHAISTLQHLPYFSSPASIHYKSTLVDYMSMEPSFFTEPDWHEEAVTFANDEGEEVDPRHVVAIAWGHESGGRDFWLNVWDGEVMEEEIRCQSNGSCDVWDFLEWLKREYLSLTLVPCVGKVTIEARGVEENEEVIREEDVCAQEEEWFTDLDVQYVRQLYRACGWPEEFRKEEAFEEIQKLMKKIEEKRGVWECDAH
ncbi:hypothetical protein BKA65DRAFT_262299 [Rhexocercosporidium sp. MPI-PUGE-AT-0058]|nr:hypothetical protein BKA65DRAFT_262299 [Rhexocercosporidium sp. MPI-PUGE-AT-0058]